ncbi:MAG: primosomal protein N' [Candidatus Moranbacteria bacterium]|nr:primosomal protein N' [Candidatus Moranbacteria bacterium]
MNKKGFLISVVPLVKITLSRDQFFFYSHHEKIPQGSTVKIPFGKRTIRGVVLESKSDFARLGNIELKKIIEIEDESFLTKKQLELAKFISEHYIISLGIVMKSLLVKKVKKRKSKEKTIETKCEPKKITLSKEQENAINNITHSNSLVQKFLLFGPASSGKTQVYFESIKKLIEKNEGQALILLPELTTIAQEIERFGHFFCDNDIAILHSKISKGQFFKNWQKIKSGEAKIIIGTRGTVLAPFKNLKIIIVDEEQDMSHKQWESNPRYDARTVAEKLSELFDAKLVFGSATPRIETFFKAKNEKDFKLLQLFKLDINNKRDARAWGSSRTEIASMVKERWAKNYSPISKKLEAELKWALKNNFQSILFINRQGMSGFSVCKSCKTVFKCPKCERALVYQSGGFHKCIHCTYKSSMFPKCSKCGSNEFQNVGLGTQKIQKEIEKIVPSAKIQIADSSTMKSPKSQEKLWHDFSNKKIDILIGTQMVIKNWDLPNVGLSAIIDADSLFSFPDYLTDEKAFSNISQAIGRTGRTGSIIQGKSIIQAFHDENIVIQCAKDNAYEKFFEEEIENREALNYPPFCHILKLLYQDSDKEEVRQEVEVTYKKLISALGETQGIKIYPPQDSLVSNIRGRHRMQIILKIKKYPGLPKEILSIIEKLKSGWIVDVDPISVA